MGKYQLLHFLVRACVFVCFRPSSANSFSCRIEDGDFIVAATDGLFDNMYTSDITDFLRDYRVMNIVFLANICGGVFSRCDY